MRGSLLVLRVLLSVLCVRLLSALFFKLLFFSDDYFSAS